MEIIVWIIIGFLVSGEICYYIYRKRAMEREKRFRDFILEDERFRQLYLEAKKQGIKGAND